MRRRNGGKLFFTCILQPIIAIFLMAGISSCAQKMICPAYQSAFIFDTTALKEKFSYFVNDTPKIIEVNKNKFLLLEPVPYRKQLASFRTIEMLPIYPVIPDSLRFTGDQQMKKELDVQDSTATDTVMLHPGLIGPKFNVEQENYMYYFRKTLVLPDVRSGIANQEKQKKKFFQRVKDFFKRPFEKRKKRRQAKAESDGTSPSSATDTTTQSKPKRGLFDRFKRDKSKSNSDSTQVGSAPPDTSSVASIYPQITPEIWAYPLPPNRYTKNHRSIQWRSEAVLLPYRRDYEGILRRNFLNRFV